MQPLSEQEIVDAINAGQMDLLTVDDIRKAVRMARQGYVPLETTSQHEAAPYGIGFSLRDQILARMHESRRDLIGRWRAEHGDEPWEVWTEAHGHTMRLLIGRPGARPPHAMSIANSAAR